MIILIILLMIFCHIIADFCVQNDFMANFKQKKKWNDVFGANCPKQYQKDYLAVLFVHALSWSFITFLPLLYYVFIDKILTIGSWCIFVIIEAFVHMYIDDMKCNKYKINLIIDQLLHLVQIASGCLLIFLVSI